MMRNGAAKKRVCARRRVGAEPRRDLAVETDHPPRAEPERDQHREQQKSPGRH